MRVLTGSSTLPRIYINELGHSLALTFLHLFVADIRVGEGGGFVPGFKGTTDFIRHLLCHLHVGGALTSRSLFPLNRVKEFILVAFSLPIYQICVFSSSFPQNDKRAPSVYRLRGHQLAIAYAGS